LVLRAILEVVETAKRYSQKLIKWYVSRGRTYWSEGKPHDAYRMWGKAGYVARRMYEIERAVKEKLPAPPKVPPEVPPPVKLNRYEFLATLSYKAKTKKGKQKAHDFLAEIRGEIVAQNVDEAKDMLLLSLAYDEYYWFLTAGDLKFNIIRVEPTDEKERRIKWEIAEFQRL
jgi:hypothetical protein